jgi:hypothetical protein
VEGFGTTHLTSVTNSGYSCVNKDTNAFLTVGNFPSISSVDVLRTAPSYS